MKRLKSILKLTFANIRKGKGAFKSIFFLVLLLIFAFSPTVSNDDNLVRGTKDAFSHGEVGDLVITLSEKDYTDDISEALNSNPHVTSWRAYSLIRNIGDYRSGDKTGDMPYRLSPPDGHYRLMKDDLSDFEEDCDTRVPQNGEIFISYGLSQSLKAEKGDPFTVKTCKGEVTFTISGIVEEPIYGSPMIGSEKTYISQEDYDMFLEEYMDEPESPYRYMDHVYMLMINGDGTLTDTELSKELNDECGIVDRSILYITSGEIQKMTMLFSNIGTKILVVFIILLTTIVCISLYNSISTSVRMDYTELGVLKSQGFTTGDIRLVYIFQYAIALIGGALVGVPLSVPLTRYAGKQFIRITGILTYGDVSYGKCVILALGLATVCLLAVTLALHKVGSISPVKAINGGSDDVYFSSLVNSKIRKKGLHFHIALRQITSRINNYVGIIIITALLSFFMIGIAQMIKNIGSDEITGIRDDIRIGAVSYENFEYADMDRVKEYIGKECPDAKVSFLSYCDLMVDDIVYNVSVYDDVGIERSIKPIDGRVPKYDNEILLTDITAEELQKDIGDKVVVKSKESEKEFIVVGRYQTLEETGRTALISYDGASELGCPVDGFTVSSETLKDPKPLIDLLNDEFGDILTADEYKNSTVMETLSGSMDAILNLVIGLIYGVSALFAFFVIYMLCKKEILREKHDLGVFKAEGFGNRSLRFQFSLRFLTISLAGNIIGIVLAYLLTEKMYVLMFRAAGITNFVGDIDPMWVVIPVVVINICFFVFSFLCSGTIKRVDVKELITE